MSVYFLTIALRNRSETSIIVNDPGVRSFIMRDNKKTFFVYHYYRLSPITNARAVDTVYPPRQPLVPP